MNKELLKSVTMNDNLFDIFTSSIDFLPNSKKGVVLKNKSEKVYYPKNRDELQAILQTFKCVLRNGGTSNLGQIIPESDEVIVDLSKLNRLEYKGDHILIGAGVSFLKIIRFLSKYNKELGVFPSNYKSSTPSGYFNSGSHIGIGSYENGEFINTIKELSVVTGNGEYLTLTGDSIKELANSEGSLGAIYELKLNVYEKKRRSFHMYGFGSKSDLDFYLSNLDKSRFIYILNKYALVELNLFYEWELKNIPEYTVLVQDYNFLDDYDVKNQKILFKNKISSIYRKEIVMDVVKNLSNLELNVLSNKPDSMVTSAKSDLSMTTSLLKFGESYKMPIFAFATKKKISLRYFFKYSEKSDLQNILSVMGDIYKKSRTCSYGRYFLKYSYLSELNLDLKNKYNFVNHLQIRPQMIDDKIMKKLSSTVVNKLFLKVGGKLW